VSGQGGCLKLVVMGVIGATHGARERRARDGPRTEVGLGAHTAAVIHENCLGASCAAIAGASPRSHPPPDGYVVEADDEAGDKRQRGHVGGQRLAGRRVRAGSKVSECMLAVGVLGEGWKSIEKGRARLPARLR
jgi:hypothetical protein